MNLATMAEEAMDRLGVVESMVFDGEFFSNAQLFGYSKRIHRRLEDLGVGRGACIVLCMVNHPLISISAMPMAHIFGVGVMVTGYLMPKEVIDRGGYGVQMAWFEPEPFMALLQEHRCNTMPAVPTMLSLILNHPKLDEYDLSSLKEVICGASPLPEEVARAFMNRFDCRVREIYGLTECTGLGSTNRRRLPYRPGSAGLVHYNNEIRIVDSDDRPLPPGESGEITLRGPTVMKGYLNQPEQTAETLRGGWLHTGDVGYLDEDGYLYVVDRLKDMIIRGGENIYPAEIEDVLYEVEGVAEAAVVGTPDPVYGESVVAFVVAAPGADLHERDIIDAVKNRASGYRIPSKVHIVETLPKTLVGKILRRELRERAREMEE